MLCLFKETNRKWGWGVKGRSGILYHYKMNQKKESSKGGRCGGGGGQAENVGLVTQCRHTLRGS